MKSYDNNRSHAPWRRSLIITIWAIQIVVLAIDVIVLGLLLGITSSGEGTIEDKNVKGKVYHVQAGKQPWLIVNLIVAAIALFTTALETSMFIGKHLHPAFFLSSAGAKLLLWIGPFGYEIYVATTPWVYDIWNLIYLCVALGFNFILFITYVCALIYAVIVYRRYKAQMDEVVDKMNSSASALLQHPSR